MKNNADGPNAESSGNRLKSEMRVYYGPSQQTILSGFTVDLSTGGLFLRVEFPLKIDEKLTLIFSLPGQNKTLSCKARVAWANIEGNTVKPELPPGVGLQFVDLSPEDVMLISKFIETYEVEAVW